MTAPDDQAGVRVRQEWREAGTRWTLRCAAGIFGDVTLDQLLPEWHFRECHRRLTNAPVPALMTAADEVTWSEVAVMRVLMGIRSAGRLRRARDHRIVDDMAVAGFTVLARSDDELLLAALGRPWAARAGQSPPLRGQADPAGFFAAFTAPGWAKMAMNFRASAGELTTETRVLLTDQPSRRAFRRYWLLIRPFSGLIRRQWLAAIARRAGRGAG